MIEWLSDWIASLLNHSITQSFDQSLIRQLFMEYRIEKDTMGQVQVPANVYWGAQTQRSIENFKIAQDINKMPREIIRAFAYLKKAAAITNFEAGVLPKEKAELISQVCNEILEHKLDDQFPLVCGKQVVAPKATWM